MKNYPHVQAAWVNAVCEEGTREELCKHLQAEWNAACFHEARAEAAEARVKELEAENAALQLSIKLANDSLGTAKIFRDMDGELHYTIAQSALRRASETLKG